MDIEKPVVGTGEEKKSAKKRSGKKKGSLLRKMVILMMAILTITIAVFIVISNIQNNSLVEIVGDTRVKQQKAISQTSQQTMRAILAASLVRTNSLQANIADNDFAEVRKDVKILQTLAEGIFEDRFTQPKNVRPPEPYMDGTPSAYVLTEEGVDYKQSEYLGKAANLGDAMTAMFLNSEKIDSCYIGFVDGTLFAVESKTFDMLDSNGFPLSFPIRERPWYKGAVEAGGVYFTGIEPDAFSGEYLITCSAPLKARGEFIGVVAIDIRLESMHDFVHSSSENSGSVFVINENGQVVLSSDDIGMFAAEETGKALDLRTAYDRKFGEFLDQALQEETGLQVVELNNRRYYAAGAPMPTAGWAVISIVDKELTELPEKTMLAEYDKINDAASEEFRQSSEKTKSRGWLIIGLLILVSTAAAMIFGRKIAKPLEDMTSTVMESGEDGKFFEMKDSFRTGDEIEVLAEAFDDQSKKIKEYIEDLTEITREKERVNAELNMANQIQASMLPHTFPAFPDHHEFDIYATMDPAREVGGDLYDYFLIDDDRLCIVIADVSGKGIPAALFMINSQAIIRNIARLGVTAAGVLHLANQSLCSGNAAEMFVTVWIGILELSTGKITAANAGHEYPVLKQDGRYALRKDKHGFVLGGMEGLRYKSYEIQMTPGDKLFLYTDGVPEATDAENRMFGMDRMIETLNEISDGSPKETLEYVRHAVDDFVNGAEQFDDLTMLCLEYKGT